MAKLSQATLRAIVKRHAADAAAFDAPGGSWPAERALPHLDRGALLDLITQVAVRLKRPRMPMALCYLCGERICAPDCPDLLLEVLR